MLKHILKRIFYGFLVILGIVIVIFFLFNVLPGDPARMMLGQRADVSSIEAINKELGRDKPLHVQFFNYLNDISPISINNCKDSKSFWYADTIKYGNFHKIISFTDESSIILKTPYLRRSYQSKRLTTDILSEAFPNTAILAFAAMLFAIIVGLPLGIISALKKDTWVDKSILVVSVFGMSLPSFFAAIIVAWVFAFLLGDLTGLNMFGSLYAVDEMGNGEYLQLKNLILPAFTLGIRPLAIFVELTRNSMLDVLTQDYIRTAKAKGLKNTKIYIKHALRNALNPVVSSMSSWLASLLAGATFIELIFDWKGIGIVIIESLEKYDFPVLMGSLLFVSIILVFINIFVDVIYAWLDPRIKYN